MADMPESLERRACTPIPVSPAGFNPNVILPYGVTTEHIQRVMTEFTQFLGFVNRELNSNGLKRLESMLMQANFSSMVGEYMKANLPEYCSTIVSNRHHNGHPDLLPVGVYPNDDVEHGSEGIEVKASRRHSGWQGHNPEDCWLMVLLYDSNKPTEADAHNPRSFRFLAVVGARLAKADWSFSGRNGDSRRTITASVVKSGYTKMVDNWIYRAPDVSPEAVVEAARLAAEYGNTNENADDDGEES